MAHTKRLIDPLDVYDAAQKESLERKDDQIARICALARKLFQILNESDLPADARGTALGILNTLHNRMGDK